MATPNIINLGGATFVVAHITYWRTKGNPRNTALPAGSHTHTIEVGTTGGAVTLENIDVAAARRIEEELRKLFGAAD